MSVLADLILLTLVGLCEGLLLKPRVKRIARVYTGERRHCVHNNTKYTQSFWGLAPVQINWKHGFLLRCQVKCLNGHTSSFSEVAGRLNSSKGLAYTRPAFSSRGACPASKWGFAHGCETWESEGRTSAAVGGQLPSCAWRRREDGYRWELAAPRLA